MMSNQSSVLLMNDNLKLDFFDASLNQTDSNDESILSDLTVSESSFIKKEEAENNIEDSSKIEPIMMGKEPKGFIPNFLNPFTILLNRQYQGEILEIQKLRTENAYLKQLVLFLMKQQPKLLHESLTQQNDESFLVKRRLGIDPVRETESYKNKKRLIDAEKNISLPKKNVPSSPEYSPKKRSSMSKNYKGILAHGLSKMIMSAKTSYPDLHNKIQESIKNILVDYPELNFGSFYSSLIDYVRDEMPGKTAYNTPKGKRAENYRLSNNSQIAKVFYPVEGDSTLTLAMKRVLVSVLIYFFESEYYDLWVQNECGSSAENKEFLIKNRHQIKNVFGDPLSHRPKYFD